MGTTLAQVLQRFGPQYLGGHRLSTPQAKAWRAIVACRTAALGGQQLACDGCGAPQWRWHSCRNRHCPQCQSRAREAWRSARLAELLNVPYCHLVFTLPHELNALAGMHPRWVYETLMQCTAATLTEFAANPRWLGGVGAFTLVLHTWTQDLRRHLHVHALMACGALQCTAADHGQWVHPRRSPHFLFPVQALSRVFRGKFLQALVLAEQAGALARDPAQTPADRRQRLAALRRHEWVVYAKTPMAGPAAVLDYLSRYTHRTAVGNERLLGIEGDAVRLRVRANDSGGKRVVKIGGDEFIDRLLQHVLPSGFKRIRHYGLLAPASKGERLSRARALLQMPQASPQAVEDAQAFMRRVAALEIDLCPLCQRGRLRLVQLLVPQRSPAPEAEQAAVSRGPP
ncbi:IS91 family transposase [Aeromonas schubertii]|uniref:IS91 family transposase n=1 Tax=Aeromonas schubertii TaxID=652 RepID=UPI001CC4C6A2|nr:IS91 family transposase [Aeromonas schubertii]MBZ6073923.1 IS91 family transposase [Aeromonas schubertii]